MTDVNHHVQLLPSYMTINISQKWEREEDQDRMAEDKGQNVKINLPTKTDDPKLSVGLVMVGGSLGKFNLRSPTNSICASIWGQKRGAAPRDQASPQAPAALLHMFLFPNLIIPTPTRARYLYSVLHTQIHSFFSLHHTVFFPHTSVLIVSY